jgi:hypothetical protein
MIIEILHQKGKGIILKINYVSGLQKSKCDMRLEITAMKWKLPV